MEKMQVSGAELVLKFVWSLSCKCNGVLLREDCKCRFTSLEQKKFVLLLWVFAPCLKSDIGFSGRLDIFFLISCILYSLVLWSWFSIYMFVFEKSNTPIHFIFFVLYSSISTLFFLVLYFKISALSLGFFFKKTFIAFWICSIHLYRKQRFIWFWKNYKILDFERER